MGDLYHANAKTTARVRKEIQESTETIAELSSRLSLNEKTVLKWKHADRTADAKSGPKNPRSTVLTPLEEQIICEFRRVTRLPLDDVFVALRDKIPALTRSNCHRCLVRHGLNRLPEPDTAPSSQAKKQKFQETILGYVHVDITEVRIEGKKLYLFVAIERVSKYAYVELHENMTAKNAAEFLKRLIADCPFKIHRILTDNGAQFTYELLAEHLRPKNKEHIFDKTCRENGIKHKLTKFRHPWTNGQVEVFNRVIKAHTVKNFYYETCEELKKHLMAFVLLHNFRRPLRALKYRTPYDILIEHYRESPQLFKENPHDKLLGLNT